MTRLTDEDLYCMNPANTVWQHVYEDDWPIAVHDVRKLLAEIEELKKELVMYQMDLSDSNSYITSLEERLYND